MVRNVDCGRLYDCILYRRTGHSSLIDASSRTFLGALEDAPCRGDRDPFKDDSHIACRAHAVPLPCRAAKALECVFPI